MKSYNSSTQFVIYEQLILLKAATLFRKKMFPVIFKADLQAVQIRSITDCRIYSITQIRKDYCSRCIWVQFWPQGQAYRTNTKHYWFGLDLYQMHMAKQYVSRVGLINISYMTYRLSHILAYSICLPSTWKVSCKLSVSIVYTCLFASLSSFSACSPSFAKITQIIKRY
jgi:hypothetical protein